MKKLMITLLFATSLYACKNVNESKPVFSLEDAKKEIAANNLAFETAVSQADSVAIANLYTEDAKWMNPHAASVEGKAALISQISHDLNAGIASAKLNTTDVWGDENYVTEEGNFMIYAKDGTQIDKGKYLVLWKRVNGKLMFFRDMFNSDLPIPTSK